jgi:hypothetical protein
MQNKPHYISYIIIGVLYVVVKIIFISLGYLHTGAVFHGLIPAILTISVGVVAFSSANKGSKNLFWQKSMLVLSALSLFLTPLYMHMRKGDQWLTEGRLEVLLIYELLASVQIIIALILIGKIKKLNA